MNGHEQAFNTHNRAFTYCSSARSRKDRPTRAHQTPSHVLANLHIHEHVFWYLRTDPTRFSRNGTSMHACSGIYACTHACAHSRKLTTLTRNPTTLLMAFSPHSSIRTRNPRSRKPDAR
eukprot:3520632-Pleurochrysis_carterae.AAC.1